MQTGLITHIQRYCVHDGRGIRTTLFFKGCPLRCQWCHNPENISPKPEILFSENRCIHCGACAQVCPNHPNAEGCTRCGTCATCCPASAKQLSGTTYTVRALVKELVRDRLFYEQSGGGVTLSGGEPLLQFPFICELVQALNKEEISVALDTCGYAPREEFLELAKRVGLVLFDLKAMDSGIHQQYTGVPNQLILDNLEALAGAAASPLGDKMPEIWVRIPIIPGVNDTPQEVSAMCKFIVSLPGVGQVNLLPYHRMGAEKYQRVGKKYHLDSLSEPTPEAMESLRTHFLQATHKTILIGG